MDDVLIISKLYIEEVLDIEEVIKKSYKNTHYLLNDVDENLKVQIEVPKGFEFELGSEDLVPNGIQNLLVLGEKIKVGEPPKKFDIKKVQKLLNYEATGRPKM